MTRIALHPVASEFFAAHGLTSASKIEKIKAYYRGARSFLNDGTAILPTLATAKIVVDMEEMGFGAFPMAVEADSYRIAD